MSEHWFFKEPREDFAVGHGKGRLVLIPDKRVPGEFKWHDYKYRLQKLFEHLNPESNASSGQD